MVNVEVVVRVFYKGKPERGLKKEDFKLIVDGKEKKIHGFFEVSKKITPASKKIVEKQHLSHFTPRLFILIFNIHSLTSEMKKILETLFQKVIMPNDYVMVFTNNSLLNERIVNDPQKVREQVWKMLEAQSNEMKRRIKQMEREVYLLNDEREMLINAAAPVNIDYYYKERYKQIKWELLQGYFNPSVKEYTAISDYLKEKKIKKWILIFYQMGRFPDFVKKKEKFIPLPEYLNTRLCKNISKSFINTGVTVHTLLMRAPQLTGNLPEEYEYRLTTTPSELILRDITKLTGGCVIQTPNIDKFVKKISKKEDIYYVLTFDPGHLKGKNYKIEVQTRDLRYHLVYDNRHRSDDFIKQMEISKEKAIPVAPKTGDEKQAQPHSQPVDLNAIFYDNRGLDLAREGQYEEALAYFSKAIQFDPVSAHLYFNRGLTYYKMKQWDNALSDYTTALKLNPQYTDACYNRGLIFLQKKGYEKAISDFTRVIEIKPNHGSAYFQRAVAFKRIGKIHEALQDYKAIEKADPVFYSRRFSEIKDMIRNLEDRIENE